MKLSFPPGHKLPTPLPRLDSASRLASHSQNGEVSTTPQQCWREARLSQVVETTEPSQARCTAVARGRQQKHKPPSDQPELHSAQIHTAGAVTAGSSFGFSRCKRQTAVSPAPGFLGSLFPNSTTPQLRNMSEKQQLLLGRCSGPSAHPCSTLAIL